VPSLLVEEKCGIRSMDEGLRMILGTKTYELTLCEAEYQNDFQRLKC